MKEILHIGDNLEYMKSLESESIDLIYGDILYGTGRNFGDYQDIKADRKTVESFYIPRISEMHRLLKKTGSIYLQMDRRINHYVRLILEDIFGIENFRNEIIWVYRFGNKAKYNFNNSHDNILFFSKSDKNIFNDISEHFKASQTTIERWAKYADENGNVKNEYFSVKSVFNQRGKDYRSNNEFAFNINKGLPIDWWDIPTVARGNNAEIIEYKYQTQKPIELMARIIKASSNEGDVCADFFAGSGSFGVAAKKLNRNIILCDINPKAIELSKKRLQSETNLFNSVCS